MADALGRSSRLAGRLGTASLGAAVLGPLAAHLGLLPPFGGFLVLALGLLLALATLVTALVALVAGPAADRRRAALGLVPALLVLGGVVLGGREGTRYPRINDITTDTARPPVFVAAGALPANAGRDLAYPGEDFARQQREGYGDTLAPLRSALPPAAAFALVQETARATPGWAITREDGAAAALEAVDTSWLFRFQDDVVIEVRPDGSGSVVDMRSKSRVGKGDMGANAKRIRAFFTRLELQPGWQ